MRQTTFMFVTLFTTGACNSWTHNRPIDATPLTANEMTRIEKCLPTGLTLDYVFLEYDKNFRPQRITIRESLAKIRPLVREGKLIDPESAKELYFYHPPGYGRPPDDSAIERDAEELQKLERKYKVICLHPTIIPSQSTAGK